MFARFIHELLYYSALTTFVLIIIFSFQNAIEYLEINEETTEFINSITYNGMLTQDMYDAYKTRIEQFGTYKYELRYEEFINEENNRDIYFDNAYILDKPLARRDIIAISITEVGFNPYNALMNAPSTFLGLLGFEYKEYRNQINKFGYVARDYKPVNRGYDVIAEISSNVANPDVDVFVATKLNPTGKTYDNEVYGDSVDESNPTGINYIFVDGYFEKEEISGTPTVIQYIQY